MHSLARKTGCRTVPMLERPHPLRWVPRTVPTAEPRIASAAATPGRDRPCCALVLEHISTLGRRRGDDFIDRRDLWRLRRRRDDLPGKIGQRPRTLRRNRRTWPRSSVLIALARRMPVTSLEAAIAPSLTDDLRSRPRPLVFLPWRHPDPGWPRLPCHGALAIETGLNLGVRPDPPIAVHAGA